MTGSGDADLYVRQGTAPTTSVYDCRPYKSGSVESCVVEVVTPSVIHVMVRGYAANSGYELIGSQD
jgi:serine protease